MSEEILINSTSTESRVAMVDNGLLQEVWLERADHLRHVGNIYKGTVCRVLPGMQAAFVDIGLKRTAFLHASDIYRPVASCAGDTDEDENSGTGVIAHVDVPPINSLIVERAEVFVQVIREPIGTKGARLSSNLSIPSRFLVLLPDCNTIGVSARIRDTEERERLKQLVEKLQSGAPHLNEHGANEQFGYIVRTHAEGVDEATLLADMQYLQKAWHSIRQNMKTAGSGDCVYEDLSMPLRALRDMLHSKVENVQIDSADCFRKAQDFVQEFLPDRVGRISHYTADKPIFDLYSIEDEIDRSLHRHSPLKSGGHLVIDQTEAMITIDVNTGGYVGHRTQEETVFKTNLEAAKAIALQLRLRNLGGIIIIDFIDMTEEQHKDQILSALQQALESDRARTQISGLSSLGLVEMTRKRTSDSLGHLLCAPCPLCSGRGNIKSAETVCLEVVREITRSGCQFESNRLVVMAAPVVVNHLLDKQQETISSLEQLIGRSIQFKSEDQYTQDQFDVVLL